MHRIQKFKESRIERFPALERVSWLRAVFIARCGDIDVEADRATAMARLERCHRIVLEGEGLDSMPFVSAVQVHGATVASIGDPLPELPVAETDGLITGRRRVALCIQVADCAAVYLVDRATRVLGLVHSGKKGTELGIVRTAIERMGTDYGTRPEDLLIQISPCIRPPHYEIDFAATIRQTCREAGVRDIEDCGHCTAADPAAYYSYRREKGRTGRMLAVLARME